ncbi:MAG: radical SAM protein [Candidatus Rokubacteria bacterium]|nr:radical SAM protein [Candidatus Rokubacteria bacterium]
MRAKVLPAEIAEDFKTSPEHVRVSIAAAMTLGLKPGNFFRNATCDCVNLLENYPAGCYANCTYCGLARERPGLAQDNTFIRVGWPVFPTDLVAEAVGSQEDRVGRVCVAMVQDKRAYPDLLDITRRIRRKSDVPISALVTATLLDEEKLLRIRDAGADIVGIGLDAASEEVFFRTRGRGARGPHSWSQHWEIARAARRIFGPMKVNCHVMVGLGETDRDLVDLFYRLKSEQIAAYLFSFNPEPGTAMADVPRAPITRWRRVQLTKYLIEQRDLPREAVEFDEAGMLKHVRAPRALIDACLEEGVAFMTNGCPDRNGKMACNRPFGSYRPGEEFRDYPFVPTEEDQPIIRQQLGVKDLGG